MADMVTMTVTAMGEIRDADGTVVDTVPVQFEAVVTEQEAKAWAEAATNKENQ